MNIILNTQDKTIIEAIELVKKYYAHPDFLLSIARHGKFNECNLMGFELANEIKMRLDACSVTVTTFKPWNPFSKTIAKHYGDTIAFNIRKDFPLMDRVETMIHELLHEAGFSHRGNRATEYNLKTVPYKVAEIFRAFVEMQEKRKEVA